MSTKFYRSPDREELIENKKYGTCADELKKIIKDLIFRVEELEKEVYKKKEK